MSVPSRNDSGAMPEFREWPKIPRFNRDVTITEKIDGTNSCVIVTEAGVYAQSRKRIITPDGDNFGFARWVAENAEQLAAGLGEGYHFGEWYGAGIQRRYGLDHKRFALFNESKYTDAQEACAGLPLDVVPVLWRRTANQLQDGIDEAMARLRSEGSVLVPGFANPEGIVIYHHASNSGFKVLLEGDEIPKGIAA